MKLSLVALLSLLAGVNAKATDALHYTGGRVELSLADADCSVDPIDSKALFQNQNKICLGRGPPNYNLKDIEPTRAQLEVLFAFEGGLHYTHTPQKFMPIDYFTQGGVKAIKERLGVNISKAIGSDAALVHRVTYLLFHCTKLSEAGLDKEDFIAKLTIVFDSAHAYHPLLGANLLAHVINISDNKKTLQPHGADLVAKILAIAGDDRKTCIQTIRPEKLMEGIFSTEDNCKALTSDILNYMTAAQREKLTSKCLKSFAGLDTHVWGAEIRQLPDKVFEEHELKWHASAFEHMSKTQVGAFDKKTSDETRGENFQITPHLKGNGSQISPTLFAGAARATGFPTGGIGDAWRGLPNDVLSAFTSSDELGKLSVADDFKYITLEQKAALFKNLKPDECESVPDRFLEEHAEFSISDECWAKLSPINRFLALRNSILSPTVLSKTGADVIEKMSSPSGDEGIANFAHFNRHIMSGIIPNMSKNSEGDHICSLVDKVDTLLKLRCILKYADEACINAMKLEDLSLSSLGELPENIVKHLNAEDIFKSLSESDYDSLTAAQFTRLAKHSEICSADVSSLNKMGPEVWKVMTKECLEKIKDENLEQLAKRRLKHIPPAAFAGMEKSRLEKLKDKLTKAQYDAATGQAGETPKEEAKKDEAPKEEAKKEEPKKEEPKKEEPKKEEAPKEEAKKDEAPKK